MTDTIRVGIAGIGGRPSAFVRPFEDDDRAAVTAICDIDPDAAESSADRLDAEAYTDYNDMLVLADLDAVVIGTPIQHHATQAIAALERDLHVLSEVPAGVTIGECRAIVRACRRSSGTYALAENYPYMRSNAIVRELVAAGLFGDPYYAEGEYLHELKELHERTRWRRVWGSGRNGITYPTHSLGPILTWFPDDRVTRVTAAGSGHHHEDPRGEPYGMEDTVVVMGETERDRLLKLRFDTLSERPHAMDNYELQGTEGCYESARASGEADRIWLAAHEDAEASADYEWRTLEDLAPEYLPDMWRDPPEAVREAGHGGGDYLVARDFLERVTGGEPSPLLPDVDRAMDMTLPGLVSVDSVEADGEWRPVPDPREW